VEKRTTESKEIMKTKMFFPRVFDNTVTAFIPQLWAEEGLALLEENMVAARLVYRDFDPLVAKFGDTVNAARPGTFVAKRKGVNDDITVQDVDTTSTPVVLNQHLHTSFLIRDGEQSKAFKDLVSTHVQPAMLSLASAVDKIVLGQAYQFFTNTTGKLGNLSSTTTIQSVVDARTKMNVNKIPETGRNLILTPYSEAEFLKTAEFTQAQMVGDDGTAIRDAYLGRKYGFNLYQCQNATYADDSAIAKITGTVSANAAIGATSIAVSMATAPTVGAFITFAGDMRPRTVTTVTAGTTGTTNMTIEIDSGLDYAIIATAVVTAYKAGSAVVSGSYAAGYVKELTVDGLDTDIVPQEGQMVAFGTTTRHVYNMISVEVVTSSSVKITLDRPLDYAVANDAAVFFGPGGSYNLAFEKGAIALVTRPLALPVGVGMAAVAAYNGLAIRVTFDRDAYKQGTLCTFDLLCGVKVLDVRRGTLMLG
jgi:hypothetical protein